MCAIIIMSIYANLHFYLLFYDARCKKIPLEELWSIVFLLIWLIYLLFKQTTGSKIKKLVTDLKESTKEEGISNFSINLPPEFIGFNIKQTRKPQFIEKIFLYSTFILSISVTVSTFIWGVLWKKSLWDLH